MSLRAQIKANRRLYTYLDRAFNAVAAFERASEHIKYAIAEVERAGSDATELRALLKYVEGIRLSEAMECAAQMVRSIEAQQPVKVVSMKPAAPRSIGFIQSA